MQQDAFGKQSASNGILDISATVQRESVAGQPMFVARLATMTRPPEITVDANMESRWSDLTALLDVIRQEEDTIRPQGEQLRKQTAEKVAEVESMKDRLRKLDEERRLLVEGLEKSSQELDRVTTRGDEMRRQEESLRLKSQQLHHLLGLVGKDSLRHPTVWSRRR